LENAIFIVGMTFENVIQKEEKITKELNLSLTIDPATHQ